MKKKLLSKALFAATVVAALGGCAQHLVGPYGTSRAGATSSTPVVTVEDGGGGPPTIRVSPRTLVFTADQKNVEIVWTIEKAKDGAKQFTFVKGAGIAFRGEVKLKVERDNGRDVKAGSAANTSDETFLDPKQTEVKCDVQGGGLVFRCTNANSRSGLYKYAVRVTDGIDTFVADPQLENW